MSNEDELTQVLSENRAGRAVPEGCGYRYAPNAFAKAILQAPWGQRVQALEGERDEAVRHAKAVHERQRVLERSLAKCNETLAALGKEAR